MSFSECEELDLPNGRDVTSHIRGEVNADGCEISRVKALSMICDRQEAYRSSEGKITQEIRPNVDCFIMKAPSTVG